MGSHASAQTYVVGVTGGRRVVIGRHGPVVREHGVALGRETRSDGNGQGRDGHGLEKYVGEDAGHYSK